MFDLFTARSSLPPCAFIWALDSFVREKCWEFQTASPLKPLGQCCSNFKWSLLGAGEQKIAKIVTIHWPRWLLCPYMVKTFKKPSSPELNKAWGLIFAQIIRDGSSTKIAKMMILRWHLTFFRHGQICFPMHLYGPYTFIYMRKNVENSYFGQLQ